MPKKEIIINTSKEYTVHVGSGLLDDCGKIVRTLVNASRIAVISDSNVAPLYMPAVRNALGEAGFEVIECVIPAGEASKNVKTLSAIWEFLAENELTRSDCIAALGGGVVGDIAGFAAATFLRGIPYVQIPTTLLAAVDSSVGGKTAIDLAAGKNLAGAFYQPTAVICDTDALRTLPEAYVSDGAAECIKYGVLGNMRILEIFGALADRAEKDEHKQIQKAPLFERISEFLPEIISESVQMKADYVCKDEFDKGDRMFLNLGHTIGHGIERLSEFKISHGHAVAIGMAMISEAGEKLGITEPGTGAELRRILKAAELPCECEFSKKLLAEAALVDKKRSGNILTLIMPESLGKCRLHKINVYELEKYMP